MSDEQSDGGVVFGATRDLAYKQIFPALLGLVRGDGELFGHEDIVDAQWRIVDPVLASPPPIAECEPGTWGPGRADELTGPDGPWRHPEPA